MRKLTTDELNRPDVADFKSRPKFPIVVILDNIRSLHNVGSIFRTADAFNLEAVYLCGITATPPHREIHRSALGATESVAWHYFDTSLEAARLLKDKGYDLVVVEQTDQSVPLAEFHPGHNTSLALVFGNEVQGVSDDMLKIAVKAVEIPQYGTKHSLNVAVTAGVVIWNVTSSMEKIVRKNETPGDMLRRRLRRFANFTR